MVDAAAPRNLANRRLLGPSAGGQGRVPQHAQPPVSARKIVSIDGFECGGHTLWRVQVQRVVHWPGTAPFGRSALGAAAGGCESMHIAHSSRRGGTGATRRVIQDACHHLVVRHA